MTSSSPAPKLPLWIFFAMDAIFVAVALAFWAHTPHPWSEATMKAVVACLICGAVIGLVPPLVFYERRKNEMLDDRQNALESLARTIHTSAEQVSIAANGLNELVELSQKHLRQAEQLPHKLQEKIAEFQAQLSNANDTEKEELEKELEELRSTESERLQSTSDKIARTAAEFAKLEASTQQHLTAANEAIAKLAMGTASAIGKAQAAAEQALAHARQEAARGIGDAAGNAVKSIEQAKAAALNDVATRLDAGMAQLREVVAQLQTTIEKLEATKVAVPPAVAPESLPPAQPFEAPAPLAANAEPAAPTMEPTATPPKRPRKQRREESHETTPPAEAAPASSTPETAASPSATPSPEPTPAAPEPQPAAEVAEVAASASERSPAAPAPLPADPVAATASPVEPPTAPEPVAEATAPVEEPPVAPPPAETQAAEVSAEPAPEAPKPARKRAKKPEDDQPHLGLELDEPHANGGEETGVIERVLTSDGATRLLVTAYIGIGNRLFIRGSGPGLSWEKGVPLQFVSIGKWRWETNEATAPVACKLLKNDEQECSALGTLNVDPGHQHEVTATF